MRVAVILLGCLVAVMAAPHERNIFTDFINGLHLHNPLDTAEIRRFTQDVLDKAGSDATEAGCETACLTVIKTDHLLHFGCPLFCKSYQSLVKYFHETPDMTTMATSVTRMWEVKDMEAAPIPEATRLLCPGLEDYLLYGKQDASQEANPAFMKAVQDFIVSSKRF